MLTLKKATAMPSAKTSGLSALWSAGVSPAHPQSCILSRKGKPFDSALSFVEIETQRKTCATEADG